MSDGQDLKGAETAKEGGSQPGNLWAQFAGRPNTAEVLGEKARALAPLLIGVGSENTNSLLKELKEKNKVAIDDTKIGEMFIETIFFYLHFIARIAFVGKETRNIFLDALNEEIQNVLTRIRGDGVDNDQFRKDFQVIYVARQGEYGKFSKMFPEKGEGYENTLFWEFGRRASKVLGSGDNTGVIMPALIYVWSAIKAMDLQDLLADR